MHKRGGLVLAEYIILTVRHYVKIQGNKVTRKTASVSKRGSQLLAFKAMPTASGAT